ncbi:MAG: DUF3786 domain-containing protein [Desulfobulbaceae bacterium]|jgi:hypothetical protein|nr:DUF3786 domain-containing protein [Desulfobulbaceae bacterium]
MLANPLTIFRHLEQSNCRECGEKTCLAFAAAVAIGQKPLAACPRLSATAKAALADVPSEAKSSEHGAEHVAKLKAELRHIDLTAAAERCGGEYLNGWLTLNLLGKSCATDQNGNLRTQLHLNPWMLSPFFTYIIRGAGLEPAGNWLSFRDLPGGMERYPHFRRRAEEAMRDVADRHPSLFADLARIFSAKRQQPHFGADLSVLLLPLPKLPLLLSYWQADEGIASELHLHLDESAGRNLDIDSIHEICAGMATMFGRLAARHGGFP